MAESTSKQLEGLRDKRVVFNTNRGGTIKNLSEGSVWEIAKEAILIKWRNGGWIWIPREDLDKYEIVEVLEGPLLFGEGPLNLEHGPIVMIKPDPLSVGGMRAEDATFLQKVMVDAMAALVIRGYGSPAEPMMTVQFGGFDPNIVDSFQVVDKAVHLATELCKRLDEMENPPKAGPNEQLDKDLG